MQNWEIKKLGEVCEINIGRTPERGNFKMWDKEKKTENVWLSISDLNNTENGYISDSTEYVSDNAVPKMKLVKANTLLMSFKLTIGRCAITKRDLFTNEAIAALPILDKNLDLFFLKYYLENFDWAKLTEGDVKVKGKTLNKEKLKEVPITLPPLEEQKRIVKILDEKFAQLETLKANAKANFQNAKDLFQSQLTKDFSNTTWEKKRLGDVCLQKQNKKWKDEQVNTEYQYIDLSAVDRESNLITETQTITKDSAPSRAQQIVKDGDVLFGTTRPTLKRVCLLNDDYDEQICSTGFCVIRANRDVVTPDWLFYQFFNDAFYKYIEPLQKGANYPAVTEKDVMNFEFPLPPLPEQKRIVEQLDSLSEKTKALQDIYKKILLDCDELKQALLQKAFDAGL